METRIVGAKTNLDFLLSVLSHPDVALDGGDRYHTKWLEEHLEDLCRATNRRDISKDKKSTSRAGALSVASGDVRYLAIKSNKLDLASEVFDGEREVHQVKIISVASTSVSPPTESGGTAKSVVTHIKMEIDDKLPLKLSITNSDSINPASMGKRREKVPLASSLAPNTPLVYVGSHLGGRVVSTASESKRVRKDKDEVAVITSMKMENSILASASGTVVRVLVKPGDVVEKDDLLLVINTDDNIQSKL